MPPKRFSRVSASMPHEKREKFDKKLEKMGLNRNVFINTKIEEFINASGVVGKSLDLVYPVTYALPSLSMAMSPL